MKKIFKLFAWLRCDNYWTSTNTQGSGDTPIKIFWICRMFNKEMLKK